MTLSRDRYLIGIPMRSQDRVMPTKCRLSLLMSGTIDSSVEQVAICPFYKPLCAVKLLQSSTNGAASDFECRRFIATFRREAASISEWSFNTIRRSNLLTLLSNFKMSFSLTFSLSDLKDLNTFLQSRSYVVG